VSAEIRSTLTKLQAAVSVSRAYVDSLLRGSLSADFGFPSITSVQLIASCFPPTSILPTRPAIFLISERGEPWRSKSMTELLQDLSVSVDAGDLPQQLVSAEYA
jgi:hypothetical protein